MKTIRTIYTALVFVGLALMTACSTDNADSISGGGESLAGNVTVHLKLSAASPYTPSSTTSRANPTWEQGTEDEGMKSWVVAFVDQNSEDVVALVENTKVSANNRFSDEVVVSGLTPNLDYNIYCFANVTASELGLVKGQKLPDRGAAFGGFMNSEWAMDGNGFDASKGIPMSNMIDAWVHSDGKVYNSYEGNESATEITQLWAVRMLAKVTFRFKNPSTTDMTINDITISDITRNASENEGKNNIMLLPDHDYSNDADASYHDQIPCQVRESHVSQTAVSAGYTYTLPFSLTIPAGTTTPTEVSFYVNESLAGKTSKYFVVTLNTNTGVKRYALFKDWTQIARNDHHILPIKLDDYKLNFKVEAFSAIGMYPSVTDNGTTLSYTCYYPEEEFHIKPILVKASDDSKVAISDMSAVKIEPIKEDGTVDASATDANNVFETLPTWNAKTGLIEGVFKGDAANKKSALYKLTVPVTADKSLEYKLLFTKDLTTFASRKHYTRKFYRYE